MNTQPQQKQIKADMPISCYPQSRKRVMSVLSTVALLPLTNVAALNKKHLVPYLSEVTGLSDSHIHQSKLDRLRPSKIEEIQKNAEDYYREGVLERGWSVEEYETHRAAIPLLSNGLPGNYSAWIHGLERPVFTLPHTKAIALRLDEILLASLRAAEKDDIDAFTKQWVEFIHTTPERDQRFSRVELEKQDEEVKAWRETRSWETVEPLLDKRLLGLYWDLFAGFDAEWTSKFFPRMEPAPVLLWIAPRVNESLVPGQNIKVRRNIVYRPVRRLLELSHALAHRYYRGGWPIKPAGRKELAEKFDISDYIVGNYFDGTRRLSLSSYQTYWDRMTAKLSDITGKPNIGGWCPYPLAVIAILWQDNLIETTTELKFESAVIIDEDDYRRTWEGYRRIWSITVDPKPRTWPEWLSNQRLFPGAEPPPQSQ